MGLFVSSNFVSRIHGRLSITNTLFGRRHTPIKTKSGVVTPTFRMPHFSRVLPRQTRRQVNQVWFETLLTIILLRGSFSTRTSAYWSNIGAYKKNGQEYAVVLMWRQLSVEVGDTDWVEEACVKLRRMKAKKSKVKSTFRLLQINTPISLSLASQYTHTS